MRIGVIAPPWIPVPPPAYGGTEEVVDLIARGLQDAGHEVLLAAAADSTCPVPQVQGTAASDPTAISTATSEAAHVVRAYRAMADMDVIHDNTTFGPLYRGRPAGIPVVWTNHGPLTADTLEVFGSGVGHGAHLVAISHRQAELSVGIPVRSVIHHGLDVDAIPLGSGGDYAAFLGRMCADKGVVEAIRIAGEAGIPLKIAAKMREPAEKRFFAAEVEPLLGAGVEYVGELNRSQKFVFLGGARAILVPLQWEEPFGLMMVEALATGTPVIATPRGAAPEIVRHGHTGYLGTEAQLAGYLRNAAELERSQCRADAEVRFNASRMAADYLKLFGEITGLAAKEALISDGVGHD